MRRTTGLEQIDDAFCLRRDGAEGVHVMPVRFLASGQLGEGWQKHGGKRDMAKAIGGFAKEGAAGVNDGVHGKLEFTAKARR